MGRGVREMGVSLPGVRKGAGFAGTCECSARAPGRAEGSPGGCVPVGGGLRGFQERVGRAEKVFFLFFLCVYMQGFCERGFPGRKCFQGIGSKLTSSRLSRAWSESGFPPKLAFPQFS